MAEREALMREEYKAGSVKETNRGKKGPEIRRKRRRRRRLLGLVMHTSGQRSGEK